MSNITSCDSGGSFCTENIREDAAIKRHNPQLPAAHNHQPQFHSPTSLTSTTTNSNGSNSNSQLPSPVKKKRSLPGNPGNNNFAHTNLILLISFFFKKIKWPKITIYRYI